MCSTPTILVPAAKNYKAISIYYTYTYIYLKLLPNLYLFSTPFSSYNCYTLSVSYIYFNKNILQYTYLSKISNY